MQSDLGDCFSEIKKHLMQETKVCFIGTPCQVYGLKSYLRKEYDNLVTVDLVCHGTPSPKLWKKYLDEQKDKYHSEIDDIVFRNKTYGYHSGTMRIRFKNQFVYYGSARVDPMLKSFFAEISSRPSCYQCHFKSVERCSDFTFQEYRETQDYKTSILSTANTLKLSKASVTSYLPYRKGVYFPSTAEKGKISVGAERQRRYRAMKRWRDEPTEENFWGVVLAYTGVKFKTYSGLPFSYEIKKGRNGEYTKELWIDRREKSKSLAWSSIVLALGNIKGEVVERPKALGDIRGVTYIYGMFYRFGLINVPDEVKEKMGHQKDRKK